MNKLKATVTYITLQALEVELGDGHFTDENITRACEQYAKSLTNKIHNYMRQNHIPFGEGAKKYVNLVQHIGDPYNEDKGNYTPR